MKRKIEILAPGGDVDCIKAAILAGADAVYCGLNKFNARNRAANISLDDLPTVLSFAHKNQCEVFITLNILVFDNEIPSLFDLLNRLVNTKIDGVIVQDIGVFYLISEYFPTLNVHASTQTTTHNMGQIAFLKNLGATRVNLSRELNIGEVKRLTNFAHDINVLTEVFVHGSFCISFSGQCNMSSVHSGNSGNRGRCSQPCRDQFEPTAKGIIYPLNLKDNSAYDSFELLKDAGVDSLKIEGRIKGSNYVYTVVDAWRKRVDALHHDVNDNRKADALYRVFNRDFSNGFLTGSVTKNMYVNSPRDHSMTYLLENEQKNKEESDKNFTLRLYNDKAKEKAAIEERVALISLDKEALHITLFGKQGEPLKIEVKSANINFTFQTDIPLSDVGKEVLSNDMLQKRLLVVSDTAFCIGSIDSTRLADNLYIPFKEINRFKRKLLFVLNDSQDPIPTQIPPKLEQNSIGIVTPSLSILINSKHDLLLDYGQDVKVHYELPNGLASSFNEMVQLFQENKQLIPWFPSILLGEDYAKAVEFLIVVKPTSIVTNNSGIAFEANEQIIPWVAGPFLNITNSHSLFGLKEKFGCIGAYLSGEMSKEQIRGVRKPKQFDLFYSIYNPIELMISQQCFFHQVTGCIKSEMDEFCIADCSKVADITKSNGTVLKLVKQKGYLNRIFNDRNHLNVDIVKDCVNLFSGFMVDMSRIDTGTTFICDRKMIVKLFLECINGDVDASASLQQNIVFHLNRYHKKGV